jgi:hypothetical protein
MDEDKAKKRIDIFMDNNPTHKQKMQQIFAVLTKDLKIEVKFHFIAAYSPKLNVVEYVIHWIRQEVLHHADAKKSLQDFQKIIDIGPGNERPQQASTCLFQFGQAISYSKKIFTCKKKHS